MAKILVVDDEMGIRELLSEILSDEGHSVSLAENAAEARRIRSEMRPDLVLLDIWMPDTDGISLLKEWSAGGLLNMPVVMMSGHGTIDSAVEATRVGAIDFLEKPIALQKLLTTVKKALKHEVAPQKPPITLDAFSRSPLLKDLRKRIEQAAAKTSILLLKSASGSIAEICARTLQAPKMPWLDLSASSAPLTHEMLENSAGGILFVADLMLLGPPAAKEPGLCAGTARKAQPAVGRGLDAFAGDAPVNRAGNRRCWRAWAKSGWPCRSFRAIPTTCRKLPACCCRIWSNATKCPHDASRALR